MQNHVSIVNDVPINPKQIEPGTPEDEGRKKIDLYAGARLVPQTANIVISGKNIAVNIKGVNKGVSKIYLPYKMKYEIRNSCGEVVMNKISSCNPTTILPGKFEISDNITHSLKNGEEYNLSLKVYHTKKIFKDFRFAAKNLTSDGSLDLGKCKIN